MKNKKAIIENHIKRLQLPIRVFKQLFSKATFYSSVLVIKKQQQKGCVFLLFV